jgi:hypothetical protein
MTILLLSVRVFVEKSGAPGRFRRKNAVLFLRVRFVAFGGPRRKSGRAFGRRGFPGVFLWTERA